MRFKEKQLVNIDHFNHFLFSLESENFLVLTNTGWENVQLNTLIILNVFASKIEFIIEQDISVDFV